MINVIDDERLKGLLAAWNSIDWDWLLLSFLLVKELAGRGAEGSVVESNQRRSWNNSTSVAGCQLTRPIGSNWERHGGGGSRRRPEGAGGGGSFRVKWSAWRRHYQISRFVSIPERLLTRLGNVNAGSSHRSAYANIITGSAPPPPSVDPSKLQFSSNSFFFSLSLSLSLSLSFFLFFYLFAYSSIFCSSFIIYLTLELSFIQFPFQDHWCLIGVKLFIAAGLVRS